MRYLLLSLFAACVAGAVASPFQNGSFEFGQSPPTSAPWYRPLGNGNTDMDGWSVIGERVDWTSITYEYNGEHFVHDGNYAPELINRTSLSQTFDVTDGILDVSFWTLPFSINGVPLDAYMDVTVIDASGSHTQSVNLLTDWHSQDLQFSVTGSWATLQLTNVSLNYQTFVDDVQVNGRSFVSTPEPVTMSLGFAAIGLFGCRRIRRGRASA